MTIHHPCTFVRFGPVLSSPEHIKHAIKASKVTKAAMDLMGPKPMRYVCAKRLQPVLGGTVRKKRRLTAQGLVTFELL